jgi:protease II
MVHHASTGSSIKPCGFTRTEMAATAHASSYCLLKIAMTASHMVKVSTESLCPHTTVSNSSAGLSATISIAANASATRASRRTNANTTAARNRSATMAGPSTMIRSVSPVA